MDFKFIIKLVHFPRFAAFFVQESPALYVCIAGVRCALFILISKFGQLSSVHVTRIPPICALQSLISKHL